MRNSIIKNQSGFSLPEILVAVGLMGGISLVSMKLMDQQAGNEKVLKANAEVNKAVALVQAALSGDASCKSLLGGKTPGTTLSVLEINTTRSTDGAAVRDQILKENTNYGAFFVPTGGIRFLPNGGVVAGNTKALLEITFWVRKNQVKANMNTEIGTQNDNKIIKTLPIEFKAATTAAPGYPVGSVVSCGPVLSESNLLAKRKFCASLDPQESDTQTTQAGLGVSYWDGTNCRLNSMDCPWGKVPKNMTSLGGIQCVDLESQMDANSLNQIIDPTSCRTTTGNFSIQATPGGRLRVICN